MPFPVVEQLTTTICFTFAPLHVLGLNMLWFYVHYPSFPLNLHAVTHGCVLALELAHFNHCLTQPTPQGAIFSLSLVLLSCTDSLDTCI